MKYEDESEKQESAPSQYPKGDSELNLHASSFKISFSPRPTWAEINLRHLTHNLKVTREFLGPKTAVMATVKADAYGHGAVECARALETEGIDWLGVALPEEGGELRAAGVKTPILCLGGFWEGQESLILDLDLVPVVFRLDLLERLSEAARSANRTVGYHLKVDTGMGRLGVPFAEFEPFLAGIERYSGIRMDGVMTHLACADDPSKREFTRGQMALFERAIEMVRA